MRILTWTLIPLLVACQKVPVEMKADSQPTLKADLAPSLSLNPQGVWLQEILTEEVRSSTGVIRCGDRKRLPVALLIDERGTIVVPYFSKNQTSLGRRVVNLGRLNKDLKIEKNHIFPTARLTADRLELLNIHGATEPQSIYLRSTQEEVLKAVAQSEACEAEALEKAIARTSPTTAVDLENRAVLSKNKLLWSASRLEAGREHPISLFQVGLALFSGFDIATGLWTGNLNLFHIFVAGNLASSSKDLRDGIMEWFNKPFDPAKDTTIGALIKLDDAEFRKTVRKDPRIAEMVIQKAQSY